VKTYDDWRAELNAALMHAPGWACRDLHSVGSASAQRYTVWDALGGSQSKPWASVYSAGADGWQWFASVNTRERIADGRADTAAEAIEAANAALDGRLAGDRPDCGDHDCVDANNYEPGCPRHDPAVYDPQPEPLPSFWVADDGSAWGCEWPGCSAGSTGCATLREAYSAALAHEATHEAAATEVGHG